MLSPSMHRPIVGVECSSTVFGSEFGEGPPHEPRTGQLLAIVPEHGFVEFTHRVELEVIEEGTLAFPKQTLAADFPAHSLEQGGSTVAVSGPPEMPTSSAWPGPWKDSVCHGRSCAPTDTLRMDGRPLEPCLITFLPESGNKASGPHATGLTDQHGHYRLRLDDQRIGASLGWHRVLVQDLLSSYDLRIYLNPQGYSSKLACDK